MCCSWAGVAGRVSGLEEDLRGVRQALAKAETDKRQLHDKLTDLEKVRTGGGHKKTSIQLQGAGVSPVGGPQLYNISNGRSDTRNCSGCVSPEMVLFL